MTPCKSESIKELATALSKAQALMEGAKKDSDNPFFKSKYANLEAVWECARKPLTDNGLSVIQLPGKDEQGHFLETTLMHSSGEFISGRMYIAPVKEDPQGIGSAITYARRYALMSALGIAPEDDDGEAAMGRGHGSAPAKATPKKPVAKATTSAEPEAPLEKKPWKATIWHLPFGHNDDKTYEFKGHTLAEIHLNAPAALAYWCRKWTPIGGDKPSAKDALLRAALDECQLELAKTEAAPPSPPVDTVPMDTVSPDGPNLLADLKRLCEEYAIPEDWLVAKANAKRTSPIKALDDLETPSLEKFIAQFNAIRGVYEKEQGK